ncbi:hypothetical protein MHYP_G00230800 [Metynnis hypsauchen]
MSSIKPVKWLRCPSSVQSSMKVHFDKQAVQREFKSHDKVLFPLPLSGSALRAKFSGPYEISKKLSVKYVVSTPDHKQQHCVCHVYMLKPYVTREEPMCPKPNSELLLKLDSILLHLPEKACTDLKALFQQYANLFTDVPQQTNVLKHDLDEGGNIPIKQNYYRVSPEKHAIMQTEVESFIKHGLASPSSSPWSSPCLLVPKPDGT